MSYMTDKYDAGEYHITEDGIYGWLLDNGEFRPWDKTQMKEIIEHDPSISIDQIERNEAARKIHMEQFFKEYAEARANRTQEQIDEENFELRAAFGPGATVVDIVTGERKVV